VRITRDLPTTPTNKILKRVLVHEKFRSDRTKGDQVWVRGRREDAYRALAPEAEVGLKESFIAAGRQRFWDL
jgi:hypothetical protein